MKKISIITDKFYHKNRLFDELDRISNRDKCLSGFILLKKHLLEFDIDLCTNDIHIPESSDLVIYTDMNQYNGCVKAKKLAILFESAVVSPKNWEMEKHKYVDLIFTWNDDFIDNKKYFKVNFVTNFDQIFDHTEAERKNFCCAIAGNKFSNHPNETYSIRKRYIKEFQKLDSGFHLYGNGWDRIPLKILNRFKVPKTILKLLNSDYSNSYKGNIDSKYSVLKNYNFSLCIENAQELNGYITEKIFDCMVAGAIPIYHGAPNIKEYVPADCFIDVGSFSNPEKCYQYLKNLKLNELVDFRKNISRFIQSEKRDPFTPEHFASTIGNKIISLLC